MSEVRIDGTVRVLGLSDWWSKELKECDRDAIKRYYGPGQGTRDGALKSTSESRVSFLTNIASWLNREDSRFTAYKCIDKADEIWPDNASVLDQHFGLSTMCKVFYRWRETDAFALDRAVEACRRSISIHHEAAAAFRAEVTEVWGEEFFPGHYCFKQLAIIEEKNGNLSEAIRICEEAKQEGWSGDWDKRIARLRKRLAK